MSTLGSSFSSANSIVKHPTAIPGLDHITMGGLPRGRVTLLSGTAGSAKTVMAGQFLAAGIEQADEAGVFVTFEEHPAEICRNLFGFGWDVAAWVASGKWAFVDASPEPDIESAEVGSYDLGALLARIEHAIKITGASRLALDSLGAIFSQFTDVTIVRQEMLKIAARLRELGITALLTAERIHEYGEVARYGVEEFVADNVIVLRNVLEDEKRRRTIEVLKFRGATHQKGEFSFTVMPDQGVVVIPLSAMELEQKSSQQRITSGNTELDLMCGDGFFRDSIILVSGATGTGKTLMVTEFIAGGAARGERCLLFAFEESREQLHRNAAGWGVNFDHLEDEGRLKVVCRYPEVAGLEEHLIHMKQIITEFNPDRVAIDSLSALERVATVKGFREFVIALTSFIKHRELAGLFTSTTPTLLGGTSVTEAHISTLTDSIILLRYVEMAGIMRRGLAVLKMRGSRHDTMIREYTIDNNGMHIDAPFKQISGILSGHPIQCY